MKIKFISDKAIDISKYSGSIAVTFYKDDRELAKSFFTKIREKGFKVIENEIDDKRISGSKYIEESNEIIKHCRLLLVIFTDKLMANEAARRLVWYQIGFMETIKKDHIALVRLSDDPNFIFNEDISSWPTKERLISVVKDDESAADAVESIVKKYGNELLKISYFDDERINLHLQNRVKFHELHVSFVMEEVELEELQYEYESLTGEEMINESRNALLDCMTPRTKTLRFGYVTDDVKLSIYKDEMDITKNNVFPIDFPCKKSFVKSSDGVSHLDIKFLFPVHDQLGATIKHFIKWENENTFSVLQLLFSMLNAEDEKDKDVYVVEDECVIYFKPTIRKAPEHDKDAMAEWGVGDRCEFVYPQ